MPELVRPGKINIMDAIGDPAPSNRWGIAFSDLPTVAIPASVGKPEADADDGKSLVTLYNEIDINMHATSTGVPRRTAGDPITIQIRGHEFERPGSYNDEHTFEMEFVETTNNNVARFLKGMRDFMWNTSADNPNHPGQQGGFRAASDYDDYTFTCRIERMDNRDEPIWYYEMHGCYYRDHDPVGGQLGSDDEPIRPTFTLYYDYFFDGALPRSSVASSGGQAGA